MPEKDLLYKIASKDEGYELAMIGAKYGLDDDKPSRFLAEILDYYDNYPIG